MPVCVLGACVRVGVGVLVDVCGYISTPMKYY